MAPKTAVIATVLGDSSRGWVAFGIDCNPVDVVVLGICGGSGSGKSTLATAVTDFYDEADVAVLSFDAYYKDLSHMPEAERRDVNFDHPDSLDVDLYVSHIDALRAGQAVGVPVYDFSIHTRTGETIELQPAPVVVAEGILLLSVEEIASRLDVKVFLNVPEPVRFERRLARDTVERGRNASDVARQFGESVAPMHDEFVQPYSGRADLALEHPWNVRSVAADLAAELTMVTPA